MTQTFNPSEHLIKIKTKRGLQDYLNVQSRLMWFRDLYPHGVVTTQMAHLDLDRQIAVFHAHVEDGEGGIGEGYGSESYQDFPDYIEKASTKSIGRALLALGFGTCFAGDELDEAHRIVDAPVDRAPAADTTSHNNGNGTSVSGNATLDAAPPSAAQLDSLKKLALHLGEKIARPKTYAEAKKMIDDLQVEYDEMISRGRAS